MSSVLRNFQVERFGCREEEKRMSDRKTFTVNGRISAAARNVYYFVDPTKSNQEIIEKISKQPGGNAIMMFGARGIGKSTRIARLVEQLADKFFCITLSLQSGIEVRQDSDRFWKSFGRSIQLGYPDLPQIHDASDFRSLFSLGNQDKYFEGKPVVLFVDEFDLLYCAKHDLLETILGLFRDLKQQYGETSCLYTLIAAGPFSILKLTGRSSSPFNVSDALSTQSFTRGDTEKLFREYSETTGIILDSRIVEDIYSRTKGHAGLTCFCGKQLDEVLLRGSNSVTFEEWLGFCVERLIPNLRTSWATMGRLVDAILEKPDVCSTLGRWFLRSNSACSLGHDHDLLKHAEFLTSEGVLVRQNETTDTFAVASPLVRHLVLWAIQGKMNHTIPKDPVPMNENNILDVPELIKIALSGFNQNAMREAPKFANKKARNNGTKKDLLVPHEACYHFELFNVLASWTHSFGSRVYTEANAPLLLEPNATPSEKKSNSSRRCDLCIRDNGQCYAIELMASSDEFQKHIDHSKIYKKALNAHQTWIVNFFTSEKEIETFRTVQLEDDDVKILHVCHDIGWTWAQICLNGNKPGPIIDLTGIAGLHL